MNRLKNWLAPVLGVGAMLTTLLTWQQPANAATPGFDGALTVTTANQIINQYADLTAIDTAARSITVDNIANLTSSAPVNGGALVTGDLLMLYQAQGASIDTTDTASYGNVTAYNNSGQYQFVTVGSITGNTITLASECGALIAFDPIYAQVVRVPQLSSLTVSGTGSITAPAWNGTTGGIVVADVSGATSLSSAGAINVNAKGFRGAAPDTNSATTGADAGVETGYRFATDATSTTKGEGIAGPTASLTNGAYGRGAPANGGGGGNGHNAGGGGGSNGGALTGWNGTGSKSVATATWANAWNLESAGFATDVSPGGGRGGYTYFASNQDALTLAPGAAAWGGDQRDNVGGFGGRPLDTSGNRAFLGGGGGAGEWNGGNAAATVGGGNGGGLVYLTTGSLAGTGSILANGGVGGDSGATDSASGGGGGGAILIESSATAPAGLNLIANGGVGGSQTANNGGEGEGPGGGGGGGYIAVSGGTKTANGGANGTSVSALITEFIPNGATMGTAGTATATPPTAGSLSCYTPRIGIAKEIGTPTVSGADNSTYDIPYTIRLSSHGEDLTGVTVSDNLATAFPGATLSITAGPTLSAISAGSALTLNSAATFLSSGNLVTAGNLARQTNGADAAATITFTVRVRPATDTTSSTVFSNSATANGTFTPASGAPVVVTDTSDSGTNSDTNGNRNSNETGENDPTTNSLPMADLSLSKSSNVTSVAPSGAVAFTLIVSNAAAPDSSNAGGVSVTDLLPAGFTFVSSTPSQGTYTSATGIWNVGTVNAGASATLTINATLSSGGTSISNTAQISDSSLPDPDSIPGNSLASEDDQANASVSIASLLQCDTLYAAGNAAAGGNTFNSFNVYTPSGTPVLGTNLTTLPNPPGQTAAIAITPNTFANGQRRIYYVRRTTSLDLWYWDGVSHVNTGKIISGGTPAPTAILRMGATDAGLIYMTDTNARFWTYDPATDTLSGTPTTITNNPNNAATLDSSTSGGDLAFDSRGVMYVVGATATEMRVFRVDGLTTTPVATLIDTYTTNTVVGSVGFFTDDNLYMIAGSGANFQWNLKTGMVSTQTTMARGAADLTSCRYPDLLDANEASKTVTKVAGSAGPTVRPGDTLEYTVVVRNAGTGPSAGTTFVDAIPSGTTYVTGSSTLNASAITDLAGGVMPFTVDRLINSSGQGAGLLVVDGTPAITTDFEATIRFQVTVNTSGAPSSVSNQGTVNNVPNRTTSTNDPGTPAANDPTVISVQPLTSIAGTVWDDRNGNILIDGTPVETGTDAGGLFVYAVNSSGDVVSKSVVAGNGTYNLTGMTPGSYTLRLSTNATPAVNDPAPATSSLPTGWVNTGENKSGTTETVTPGEIILTVVSSDFANMDFGIEQPPTANVVSAASQNNPGGSTLVTVPALGGTDPEDGTLGTGGTIIISSLATNGTLSYDGTPVTLGQVITGYDPSKLKVDPDNGAVTVDFTYQVRDAAGKDSPAVTVSMPFTNLPPVAADVSNPSIAVNAAATGINALQATDPDDGVASYTVVTLPNPAHGILYMADGTTAVTVGQALTLAEAASLKFDPSGTYVGDTSFTFSATDFNGASDASPATFTIPIGNTPPTATDVTTSSLASTAGATTIDPLLATDVDGTIASFTVSSLPPATQGVLLMADGTTPVTAGQVLTPAEAASLKFDPSGTYTGNVTFTFTTTDNNGAVDASPATYTIPVGNEPPTATDVTNASLSVGAGPTAISSLAATDTDGTIATYTVSTLPPAAQGVLYMADGTTPVTAGQVLTPAEAAGLKFDPSGTFAGSVTFTFTATDNDGAVDGSPATYTIPVSNQPPVANDVTNASIPSSAGATTIDPLAATDGDGTIASFTISSLPAAAQGVLFMADGTTPVTAGQVLTPAEATSLKFDPNSSFTGSSTFTFTATDNLGLVDLTPAIYTIPVGNNPPVALDVTNANIPVNAGPTTLGTGLAATDADGTIASYTISSLPPASQGILYLADGVTAVTAGQILTPAEAAGLKFDPSGTFVGDVTFTYSATDDNGLVDGTPATYTVPLINQPPTATDVTTAGIGSSAGPTAIDPLIAADTDGTISSFTVSTLPPAAQGVLFLADGTTAVTLGQVLTPAQASSLKFDPSGLFTGNVTFTFTATDNNGLVDATPATYTIPIGNTPPVAADVTTASLPSTAGPSPISSLVATDTDGTVFSYTVSTLPPAAQGVLYLADGVTPVTAGQVLTPAQAASLKLDPSGTFTGNVTFTFTATDNDGADDGTPATYTIPVGNEPPTATDVTNASLSVGAGPTAISSLAATDTDGTIASFTISSLPPAAQGTLYLADGTTPVTAGQILTPAEAGSLKFDPSGTFTGNVTFTFTATDNDGAVDASPATYTIPLDNAAPTATPVTTSSIPSSAGPTAIDPLLATDGDGTIASFTVVTLPTAAQGVLLMPDGLTPVTVGQVLTPTEAAGLKFDPAPGFTGNVTFTFTATDNLGLVDASPATYTIPVGNTPPVATDVTNPSIPSTAGATGISSLAATDSDGTVASFTVSSLPAASQGVLYLGATPVTVGQILTPTEAASLSFDPNPSFTGDATFTFTATDNLGLVDATPATYTIPVGNNPPTAGDVTNAPISVGAGPTTLSTGLTATDTDGTVASYTISSLPPASQGVLYLADGTTPVNAGQVLMPAEAAGLKFDPSGTYSGPVTFTYTATDNLGLVDATPATYTIPVTNVAPQATDVTTSSIPSSATAITIDPLAATDADGTIASYTVVTLPPASEGVLYLADGTTAVTVGQILTPAQASSLKFDPAGTFTGVSTFTFTATDNLGVVDASPAIYSIPVGNNPPVAQTITNSSLSVAAGPTTLATGLAATDADGTIASYTILTLPPVVQGSLFLTDGVTAVTAGQVLTPAQAAGLKFDPSGNFAGNVTFTYTATDNAGLTDGSAATYTIPLTNTPPVATPVTTLSITSSAGPTAIDPLAATDSDGTIASFTVVSLPPASQGVLYLADGTTPVTLGQVLTPAQAATLKFDPSGTFTGNVTFTFTATDNLGVVDSSVATYTIPVGNVPPVPNDVTNPSISVSAGPTAILGLDATDSDGTISSFTVVTLPPVAQGTLFLADGTTAVTAGQVLTPVQAASLKFDPSGTFSGNVTFTFNATDNDAATGSSPATFNIPLGNNPPVANSDTNASIPSSAGATAINALTATDADGTVVSYTVLTLPSASAGVLYLADGTTAVTVGQVLTPAQAATLKFDPNPAFTGNTTFTFTATDNTGATDLSAATITIPVGNNPPVANDVNSSAMPSNAGPTAVTALNGSDTDGTIASFTISSLPPAAQGTLLMPDGVTPVTAGQVLTPAEAATLKFDPSGSFNGNVTFTYTTTDNLGLTDATPATVTIPVTNTPPVANNVTNPTLAGSAGPTTISSLDATDADGTISSYTVVTLPPAAQGTLFLADGTTPVTAGQVLTPAQAATLKFDPSGTFTGNVAFTFTATDNQTAVDATPATFTIPVGNNPPNANDITNPSLSSGAGPTTISSLVATDSDGTVVSYKISSLPAAAQGTLFLADGVTAVTVGQILTPAQAAGLKFDPSGTFAGNATFTYTATDNDGADDPSPATFTIPVTNQPPVASNVTTSNIPSSAAVTTIDPLSATDPDGTIASFTVITLPAASEGILYLADGTTAVTVGQVLTPAQASSLKFDPAASFTGNSTFTFTATDNLGLVDASAATYTIPVSNTPPVASDVTTASLASSAAATAIDPLAATDADGTISSFTVVTLPTAAQGILYLADGTTAVTAGQVLTPAQAGSLKFDPSSSFTGNASFTFTATDNLGLVDATPATYSIPVGNNPPVANSDTNASIPSSAGPTTINALTGTDTDGTVVSYTILTLPTAAHGVLYFADGTTPITVGQILTPAQAAGLKFDPAPTFTGSASFTFTATDNSGVPDPSAATITIPVGNTPPDAANVTTASIASSAAATTIDPLVASDADGTVASFTVVTLPTAAQGILLLADGTTPVTAGQVLTPVQASSLKFDPSSSFSGNATFTFTATDNLGLVDATPATYTIPVGNTPPVAADVSVSSIAASSGPTAIDPLLATDSDGTIASFTVVTLPTAAQGVLFLADGTTAVTAGQVLTPAQAATLKFDPVSSFTGNATFTFTATDNSGTPDASPATYTIPVGNNPPVAADINNPTISASAGPTTISSLTATDSDGTIASFTVLTLPTAAQGVLYLADGTTPVTVGQVLTPAQASTLKFDPNPSFTGNATFTYTATDDSAANDPSAATVTIPVTNTPPVATNVSNSSIPSGAGPTTINPLAATDADGTVVSYTISSLPPASQGVVYLADDVTPVTVGQLLTPAQAATLKFDPSGTYNGPVTFTFTATDDTGATDPTPATVTIPVSNVPPVANDMTNPTSIASSAGPTNIVGLDASDADGTIASYTVVTLPPAAQGTLFLSDGTTPVTAGQVLTLAQALSLKFDPSGTFTGNVTFTFSATDNQGLVDVSAATYTISVGNNPPVVIDTTGSSISSNAGPSSIGTLTGTDSDGTVVSITVVTLPPASQGVLYLADGVTPVTAGQVLTPAQAASLKFDPSGTYTGPVTFDFTATDNSGTSATPATFTIPVTNTPPVAANNTASSIPSSAGATTITALAAADSDGSIVSYTVITLPLASQGVLFLADGVTPVTAGQVLTPSQASSLKFDPAPSFTGNATFTFTATDDNGLVDATPATVTIPVGNTPPVANNVTNPVLAGTAGPTTISSLDATDSDGTISSYTIVTLPPATQGTLFLADGTTPVTAGQILTPAQAATLKFDPSGTFAGNVTFTFTATDNSGSPDSTPATFTIPVGNNPPVATNVSAPTMLSSAGPTTIPALAATDSDGMIASYTVLTLPSAAQGILYLADGVTPVTVGQVLTPAQAAGLKFDPAPTFSGNATFTFTATDNSGTPDPTPATVTIPVGNVPPTATPVVAPSMSSSAGPTALPALTGTDPDGTVSSITITTLPPAAQGVLNLNGTPVTVGQVLTPAEAANLKFDPAPTFTGDAGFQFTVTDNSGNTSSPANVTIPVVAGPTVTKTFASSTVAADGTVAMSITITNPNSSAMTGVALTDSFPAGLEIASTPIVSQCGGTVSSTATTLSLNGGTIAANSSCTITATVKPTKIGAITNVLPAGAVTTTNAGSSPAPASATLETASVGAAKSASVINNGDGTYNITYLINVSNLGSVPLTNVQAVESLETTFTGAATWSIVGTPSITSGTGLTINPAFTGSAAGSTNLLTAASSNLAVGATSTVSLTVRVNPNGNPATTTHNNQVTATATGNGPGGATPAVSDLSSNSGTNPDPNGNGNPNEPGESDPTRVSFSENPSIGVAKSAGALTSNGNGTYTQAFSVIVRNYGDVPLSNLSVTENLSSVFGAALVGTSNLNVTGAASVTANVGFNGTAQTNLAATGGTLAVGATATFTFDVVIRPSATASSFTNSVTARGSSPSGSIIADDSVNGLDPNPTPGSPNNDTSGTPIVFAKLTGHVFSDINGNGTQNAGEPNLNANTVTVTPVNGPAFTILTDTNGDYTAIVPAGSTKLEATVPTGNLVTTGNNPQNINAVAGTTASTPVGFQPKGTIKGHVFTDLNAGGSQQPAEPNANGLTVTITDWSGATQTVTTDANGDYTATVPFGPVTTTVTLPPGSRLTTANNPQTITITDTSVRTLSPVGYHQDGLISGLIFEDLDGNGVQDIGENGLAGIPVKITDSTGKVFNLVTDPTGAYSQAVPAGSTTIEVVTPGGTLLTTANGTQNVTAVSKTLTKATKIGFQPQNKVVGHVFNDPNANGIQDAGETNIANQDVNVTDSSGAVQTVKTNATGDYVAFVIPGKTTVNVVDPTGSSLTTANDPQDVTVLAGQTSTATPVGFQARGTLSGHLFNDVNGNGLQDPGEPNLPGLTVTITDANGAVITLISDANGDYTTSVPAGPTTVTVAGPNGAISTTGNNPQTVTVPVGGNINPTPIGFQVQSGSLRGRVFYDTNGNGVQDSDEPGIEGVSVTVIGLNNSIYLKTTDANGDYSIPSIPVGDAQISIADPNGLALTTNNNPQVVTITSGSSATAADVGYVKPSLQLSKKALSQTVAIGEILEYELVVTNSSPIDVRDVVIIDELPLGLAYKAGSSTVAGLKLEPTPSSKNGRQILTWTVPGILTPSASSTIKFATIVTPSATQKLENVATASAIAGASGASTLKVAAQSAVATTKIVQAVFNNKSVFVGRVYFDRDTDANFTSGIDKPLAGARVYLSDGRYAITDAQGRYSVPDITPGVYVVRLDRLTAPYTPVRVPTDVGLPGTRRVDAQGGLYEANFPLLEPDASVAKERETMVERGNVKLEKILERIPSDQSSTEKPGYVIRETITISKTVANLTITDPLPPGATRGLILLVGSDGKEISVTLLEDGRIQIPGTLEAGTYTLVYAIYTNLTPDQVVTDPSINYDEVIR
jgi:uncharacterized repeat protein (TIGR01451 family)